MCQYLMVIHFRSTGQPCWNNYQMLSAHFLIHFHFLTLPGNRQHYIEKYPRFCHIDVRVTWCCVNEVVTRGGCRWELCLIISSWTVRKHHPGKMTVLWAKNCETIGLLSSRNGSCVSGTVSTAETGHCYMHNHLSHSVWAIFRLILYRLIQQSSLVWRWKLNYRKKEN